MIDYPNNEMTSGGLASTLLIYYRTSSVIFGICAVVVFASPNIIVVPCLRRPKG